MNTGAEAFGRAISNLGEDFWKIAAAQRVTDLETKKREYDKYTFDAHQKFMQTGDEQERQKQIRDWSAWSDKHWLTDDPLARKEYARVKGELRDRDGEIFATSELAIKTRNENDAYKANYQHLAETGQVGEMMKLNNQRAMLNRMSPAKRDELNKDAPITSAFIQTDKKLYNNPEGAQVDLALMDKSKMDENQLAQWDKLNDLAIRQENFQTVQFNAGLANRMVALDQKDPEPVEIEKSARAMEADIFNSNLSAINKEKLVKGVRGWEKGEDTIDFPTLNSLNQRIDHVIQSGEDDLTLRADIDSAKIASAFGARSKTAADKYQTMLNRLKAGKHNINQKATELVRADFKTQMSNEDNGEELTYMFNEALNKQIADRPEWTPAQAFSAAKEAQTTFSEYIGKTDTQKWEEIIKTGQVPITWSQKTTDQKKADLQLLKDTKHTIRDWDSTIKVGDWNKGEVVAAQKIIGKSSEITDEHIQKFQEFLNAHKRQHYTGVGISENPYPDFPDAFFENGEWRVMRNGRKYRIKQ